ncbi:MAG: 3-deoxy-manno-octulosonate cytidylyltransferase [Deltaproteobacteria bacterium]|nr:3-deoxy-manno-octulosonate cytidylyltransferase [Deltaproteobacteria bacterium]
MPFPGPAAPRVLAVVPARYASTRFPGKPLVDLAGVPMIVRVLERAALASSISEVVAATDDERIAAVVKSVGRRVVMTSESCQSGTDRVAEAVATLGFDGDLVVNVQGDEPLLDPADLDALVIRTLRLGTDLGTLARPLEPDAFLNPNVVKVVRALDGRALYFSRAAIPHSGSSVALRHIGLYAYRPAALRRLAALEPTPLERCERLEQLRALENGLSIAVIDAPSTHPCVAVDTPADAAQVIAILTENR